MIRQCCVCKKIDLHGLWVKAQSKLLENKLITHAYCESCFKDFMDSVDSFIEKLRDDAPDIA